MKTALYILFAFYIVTLSVMPCGDKNDCNESKHTEQTSQENKHKDESCPPLCHCACCGTTFVINTCAPVTFAEIEIAKELPVYTAQMPTSVPASIWQPPKIA